MAPPKTVVIVGGSLAGLMQGVYLKRHGSHVIILEQEPRAVRSGHQAGIGFGPAAEEFLHKYDRTGIQNCLPSVSTRIAWHKRAHFTEVQVKRNLTSWGLMYSILRANFDGLASVPVPNPPLPKEGDGKAEYWPGHRVTDLDYDKACGAVTVRFVGPDGAEGSLTAAFVIGADGMNSTVRRIVGSHAVKEYSGYVAWRGTVPEKDLPSDVVEYFVNRTCLNVLGDTYIVIYVVPAESGSFEPGSRLINFVWYYNLPEGSDALTEVLTDIEGRFHANTVPAGRVHPDVWRKHLAAKLPAMAAPYATLLSTAAVAPTGSDNGGKGSSAGIFVTKVNDVLNEKAAFFDGHLVLVGDALAAFRPHLALATEQAARHCLDLARVWEQQGEEQEDDGKHTTKAAVHQWATEAVTYGKRNWLLNRLLGLFGTGRRWEFCWTLCRYFAFLTRFKLGMGPRGY